MALLLQYLVYFGNAVGRGPHYQVENDKHFAILFLLLAGETAKARKGLSAGRIRAHLRHGRSRLGARLHPRRHVVGRRHPPRHPRPGLHHEEGRAG